MLSNCGAGEDSWEALGLQGGQPVNPEGNPPWICIGRTDAEAEAPILWRYDVKNWLIGKDTNAGKDWRQEEKGTAEDEMVGWHHLLNGPEFEQALGIGDGHGSLACCSPWGCKESDTTERLNRTDESSKYSCHSYIFWMSWSLPLLQGWFPYGGKESVRKCVLCLVYQMWSRHRFPWENYMSFNQNLAGFLKFSLCLWATNFREDWQKQYKNWTLAI